MSDDAEIAHVIQCAFSSWFGLQPKESSALCTLWRAQGEYITPVILAHQLQTSPNHLCVIISQLRRVLTSEAIDSAKLKGYRLTDIGMNECMGAVLAQLQILVRLTERRAA